MYLFKVLGPLAARRWATLPLILVQSRMADFSSFLSLAHSFLQFLRSFNNWKNKSERSLQKKKSLSTNFGLTRFVTAIMDAEFHSFEVQLQQFLAYLRDSEDGEEKKLAESKLRLVDLSARYIAEFLQSCTTVDIDMELIKRLEPLENLKDVTGAHQEAAMRKHIKSLVKYYLNEKQVCRPSFKVTHTQKYAAQLELLGIHGGVEPCRANEMDAGGVDGNVVVMAILTGIVAVMALIPPIIRVSRRI